MYQFRLLLVVLSAIVFHTPSLVVAADNAWTKPNSGNWEEQAYWSLGVLPDATQSVLFTNAGWKALAIGANTAQNFPQSMRVQSLKVEGPVDSYNTLLVNWSGFERPLQTTSLTIGSNASVAVHGSVLEVVRDSTNINTGNFSLSGTLIHADLSLVKVDGFLNVQRLGISSQPGAYFLTNGILTAGAVNIGGMSGPGRFVQHGGSNNVGSLSVSPLGDFDLYGGQVTATNGLSVGYGDFASGAHFFQHGGSVNADTDVNGSYVLNRGTITGRMAIPSTTSFDRADGRVGQNGGTNFAASLDMGLHAGRRGGAGYYVLSNGVLRVGSSVTIRGGTFSQSNGVHTIASNLVMRGDAYSGLSSISAMYILEGGTLSAGALTGYGTYFQQTGGTNLIAGDVVFTSGGPQNSPYYLLRAYYQLEGGLFSARNVVLDAFLGGFRQTGGSSHITEKLTVRAPAATNGSIGYTLEGGSLSATTISISNWGVFHHTGGISQVTQLLVLPAPNERASYEFSSGRLNSARVYLGFPDPNANQVGLFNQTGGVHSNSQSIIAYGRMIGPELQGITGSYTLSGGLLASAGIGLDGGMFTQRGGTNYAHRLSLTNGGSYLLFDGALGSSNTFIDSYPVPTVRPRFVQAGGEHRTQLLWVESGGMYDLTGGMLSADRISVRAGTRLRLEGGTVSSNNTFEIAGGGTVYLGGNYSLGHLLFNGAAHIDFQSGSSVVHFTGVGYPPPAIDGQLLIHNWKGSAKSPGRDQFYIDNADESIRYRLRSITFVNPDGYPPGNYTAYRKASGEIVPLDRPDITFTREGNRMVLTWPEGYQLYSADEVTGPFEPVEDAQSGWSASFSDPQRFFLLGSAQ